MSKSKPSPINGKWALVYASDFEQMMDDWNMDPNYRPVVREALKTYTGPDRLTEEYFIDNEANTITRKVAYKQEPGRQSNAIPFETFVKGTYFDGQPTKSYYGREAGSDNMLTRFEVGDNDKLHFMIQVEVHGNTMLSTYNVRGKTYLKKFERIG